MGRRSRIEYEIDLRELFPYALIKPGADAILMDLYTRSLSNALAGYAYRAVEEMVCGRTTPPLSQQEKDYLLRTMWEECGSDLTDTEYRVLRKDDPTDSRLLFCLAIRWDNRHLKYMLADETTQQEWWNILFPENMKLSEDCFEQIYRSLGMLKTDGALSDEAKEMICDSVEQDLSHGYIVKLAESLDPL